MPRPTLSVALLALAALTVACESRLPLGEQCSLNTDCADPLVCRLGRCRNACSGDRDCPVGLHCAVDSQGLGSCLLPDESMCDEAGPESCPEGLTCAPSGLCMASCETSVQCLWSGACIESFCVDVFDPTAESDGGTPVLRDGEVCAPDELCNGMDDDCDGAIDERADAFCDDLPNASGECRDGACQIACDAGFDDCNGVQMDGCETDLNTDPLHCGMCPRACPAADGASASCSAGACGLPVCDAGRGDCDRDLDNGCETLLEVDDNHCGSCGRACGVIFGGREQCVASDCVSDCDLGSGDCNMDTADGCETDTTRTEQHCGACGVDCGSNRVCLNGICEPPPLFRSDESDGPLTVAPGASIALEPRTYNYTTIIIGLGATVTTSGAGVLELRASGDVIIDGTIDLSGSVGGPGGRDNCSPSGGATATPLAPGVYMPMMCISAAAGGSGAAGTQPPGPPGLCSAGGMFGGGNGGYGGAGDGGGGGGGGYAGGGGGGGPFREGGAGASAGGATGGVGGVPCASGEGGRGGDPYFHGVDGQAPTCGIHGNGGGGGSIGATAAVDLAVMSTLQAGSGGGGGSGLGGLGSSSTCGGGGGGAGGALRIASATAVRVSTDGALRAVGGGGGSVIAPLVTGGGGGGSGGVIYLAAPRLDVFGLVTVAGGLGGESDDRDGGDGGPGRIRLSVDPAECNIGRNWVGATPPSPCAPNTATAGPGDVYVATYPD